MEAKTFFFFLVQGGTVNRNTNLQNETKDGQLFQHSDGQTDRYVGRQYTRRREQRKKQSNWILTFCQIHS